VRTAAAVDYLSTVAHNKKDDTDPPPLLSSHGRLLVSIHQHPGLTQTEYGQHIGLSRRTIIRLLNDLEQARYITTRQGQTRLDITINGDTKLPSGVTLGNWISNVASSV